ncbi:MAG TPA: ATP-binding protein [Actinomycetota bacterium]|nr:ATP-binding protein [Actinomycetota bacterium]
MTEAILVAVTAALAAAVIFLWLQLVRQRSTSRPLPRAPRAAIDERLERERGRTLEVIDRLEEGVVVFNEVLLPLAANRSARRMLGVRGDSLPPRLNSEGVLSVARRALVEGAPAEETVSVWPGRRSLRVRAVPLEDSDGIVVVLQDVTDELRTQQVRRQFVANASHELKSPVASLQALAEAIREAVADDPAAAKRFSERLVFEAERLGRLIADLLDLSRVEDPSNISTTAIDLSGVARNVLEEAGRAAQAKRLAITAQVSSDAWVRGDEQQLDLLVRNLVDNAVRYTQEGGSVWVDLFREGDDVVLRVADDGLGIPLQAQARVFERFYRVDEDRSRARGGTGLGLSIVKHVAELHGGHVTLQSELGEGSTFTARLPALATRNGGSGRAPARDKADRR